jgi:hypothetical protein
MSVVSGRTEQSSFSPLLRLMMWLFHRGKINMVKCIRGFMTAKRPLTADMAIKQFRLNCKKNGVIVHNVVCCHCIGENVWTIVSNVEIKGGQ